MAITGFGLTVADTSSALSRIVRLNGSRTNTPAVLGALVEALERHGSDAVKPGDRLRELLDQPLRLHANIGSVAGLLPVVDAISGDPIAWVPRQKAEQ
jgi:hypothetical protein